MVAPHAQTSEVLQNLHAETLVMAPDEASTQAQASNPTLGEGGGQGEEAIEVDTTIQGDESAHEDEMSTFTASLTSSVLNYPYENGRRYHSFRQGNYMLPNDESENDRLDMTHRLVNLRLNGKLHLAPVPTVARRILDIGTGTGIWSIEMGDKYPSALVIGNDLSAVQPLMVPPNVKFEIDDVESEWLYEAPFDYIHCRAMLGAIADWPRLVRRCFENTVRGGWAEFQEFDLQYYSEDGSLKPDSALATWIAHIIQAANQHGRDPLPGPKLESWVRDAGFIEITHQRLKLPIGPWPEDEYLKALGMQNVLQILQGLEGFTMARFTRVLGWSVEEIQVLLALVRKDLRDPRIHALMDFHVVYARKP